MTTRNCLLCVRKFSISLGTFHIEIFVVRIRILEVIVGFVGAYHLDIVWVSIKMFVNTLKLITPFWEDFLSLETGDFRRKTCRI